MDIDSFVNDMIKDLTTKSNTLIRESVEEPRQVDSKSNLNFVGSFNYTPDPIEYDEGSVYKNMNEGVAYIRKGLLWEELVRDGKNGESARWTPSGGGLGERDVKLVTGQLGTFSTQSELDNYMAQFPNLLIEGAMVIVGGVHKIYNSGSFKTDTSTISLIPNDPTKSTHNKNKILDALVIGDVVLPSGTYYVDGIDVPNNRSLVGQGKTLTILKLPNNYNATSYMVQINWASCLKDLTLDGNRSNVSSTVNGLVIPTGVSSNGVYPGGNNTIENIYLRDLTGDGMYCVGPLGAISTYKSIYVYRVNGNGFYLNTFDSNFIDIDIGDTGLHGIFLDTGNYNCRFVAIKCWFSGQINSSTNGDGIHCAGYYNNFSCVELQDNGRNGFTFNQAKNNTVSSLHVESPGKVGFPGIGVEFKTNSTNNSIVGGNVVDRNGADLQMTWAIQSTDAGVNNNVIVGTFGVGTSGRYNIGGGVAKTMTIISNDNDSFIKGAVFRDNADVEIGTLEPGAGYSKGRLKLVGGYLWVDSSSRLRIKSTAPTSDTDGVVVGTQA